MATRITQIDLLVGAESSSVAFTPAGESIALTCTVTELVADSVVRMLVINDRGLVQASVVVNGTGAKKLTIGKLDGTLTVRVEQLQGSGQVTVADPDGGAVETADIADLSVTTPKLADNAVWTAKILDVNVTRAKIALLAVDTGQLEALAVETAKCEVGLLSADAPGRALIADDHFVAASFIAGAGGKFAPDCLDATACENVYPAGAIPVAKVASAPLSLESTTADPGDGQPLPANLTTSIAITTAAAETNTLAAPSAVGKVLSLTLDVRVVGDRVITVATAINQAAETVITMDTAGDNIVLVGVQIAGVPAWRVLVNDGCTLS